MLKRIIERFGKPIIEYDLPMAGDGLR